MTHGASEELVKYQTAAPWTIHISEFVDIHDEGKAGILDHVASINA